MTSIEATCPTCGPVECRAEDFELAICSTPDASWYAFLCPTCTSRIQKRATDKAIELLIAEGVTPRYWSVPAEMLEHPEGPPFTADDLLAMHELLERPDWFDMLLEHDPEAMRTDP